MKGRKKNALSPEFLRPPGFSFNTSDFEAKERYGAFLMTPITAGVGMEFECSEPAAFVCEMEFSLFGRTSLVDIRRLSSVACRIPDAVAALGMISLQICHEGLVTGEQGGRQARAARGEALLLNMNTSTSMHYSDASRVHGLYVHPSSLSGMLKRDIPASPSAIPAEHSGLKLLSAWLCALSQAGVSADESLRETIDAHLIDLIALALDARDDATEEAERRTGKTARLQAVLGQIAALSHTALNAADVATSVGISERYVRQLLEETGLTFTEHLQEQRLLRAFVMLKDPALASKKISEIAAKAGFGDPSYFNRIFRRRFGATPGALREGAER
jgi:AraC-like DNA-binding protein